MLNVRPSASHLADIVPYDPKYLPADAIMSANENPCDIEQDMRRQVMDAVRRASFNRYPDPLANDLRDKIAQANGLEREQVLMGNGGDELLFNIALAWGGPGRTLLNLPPTFSVYDHNARLTGTNVVNIARKDDYTIDEEAVLECLRQGDIDYVIITSPNNPTGQQARDAFISEVLNTTDALVVVDEAYFEFSRHTTRPYLNQHKNLLILRTFSKSFSLAGVRMGYVLGHEEVVRELIKVRQPYSVSAVSQAIAGVVYENRGKFEPGITRIIEERNRVFGALKKFPGVQPFPSDANYILFRLENAAEVWEQLYEQGILIRDLSNSSYLESCLRVSIGTPEENDAFLQALRDIITRKA